MTVAVKKKKVTAKEMKTKKLKQFSKKKHNIKKINKNVYAIPTIDAMNQKKLRLISCDYIQS